MIRQWTKVFVILGKLPRAQQPTVAIFATTSYLGGSIKIAANLRYLYGCQSDKIIKILYSDCTNCLTVISFPNSWVFVVVNKQKVCHRGR